jgi:C1A family cysteine protease
LTRATEFPTRKLPTLLIPPILKEGRMPQRKKSSRPRTTRRAYGYYGWVPDLPDYRDVLFKAVRPLPPKLPDAVDLRPMCSTIEDQGALGSCTANALAGALEFLERKDGFPFVELSRLFIYYNERLIEKTVNSDSGAMLRDGIKSLAKEGVCPETDWPYIISQFTKKPTSSCYREAKDHQITSYQRILTIDEMLACLAEGFPFVFGFTVYESFESTHVRKTGHVELPKNGERVLGGHAVLAIGYRLQEQRFTVRNSWGTGWGQKGYCTMPFEYLADRNLSDDFWVIRRGESM